MKKFEFDERGCEGLLGVVVGLKCETTWVKYHLCEIMACSVNERGTGPERLNLLVSLIDGESCESIGGNGTWRLASELYDADAVEAERTGALRDLTREGGLDSAGPASDDGESVSGTLVEAVEGLMVGDVLDSIEWPRPYVYGSGEYADAMVRLLVRTGAVVLRVYRR